MNTALITVMILAAQSPQFYYDALRQSRNPFAPTSEINILHEENPEIEPQDEEPTVIPINPDLIVKLDRLKAILITKSNKSLLYLGDEIMEVNVRFFGIPVKEIKLDRIILQNEHHIVTKVIGKPVEVKSISDIKTGDQLLDGKEQE